MAAGDGALSTLGDKVGNDPVQSGSLLSLLPSMLIHGAVVAAIWLGLFEGEKVQPPVTFISLAPAAAPAPEQAPPAPMVPAPDLEPEFEPLPLPATGMVLPQPEPPAEPTEPVVDFTPPELPEPESFPFDPKATREPEPEPEDAVAIDQKKVAEKPKEPEKPKAPEKKKEPKKTEKPKKKETKKAAAPPVAEKKPVETPAPATAAPSAASTSAKASPSASSKPAPAASQSAAISDAPVRVTNPNYAGACPISYPERARKRNQEGTVVVHALIGPDGKPIEVSVAQSSGHKLLDEAARDAISNCAFVPQKVGGRAVKAIVEIPIPFKLI
jgi:periplasmic protein TonB